MGIKELHSFIEKDSTLSKVGISSLDLVKTAWKLNKASQGQVRAAMKATSQFLLKDLHFKTTLAQKIVLIPLNNEFVLKIWNAPSFMFKYVSETRQY